MSNQPELRRRIEQLAAAAPDAPGRVADPTRVELAGLRAELAALRGELAARWDPAALEARMATIEDALDALADRLEALSRDSAQSTTERLTRLAADLDLVRGQVAGLVAEPGGRTGGPPGAEVTQVVQGELASLRADLADALEEVRDRVAEDLSGAVGEVRSAVARVPDVVQGAGATVAQVRRLLTEQRDAGVGQLPEELRAAVGRLDADLANLAERLAAGSDELTALRRVAEQQRAESGREREEWTGRLAEAMRAATGEQVVGLRELLVELVVELQEMMVTELDRIRAALPAADTAGEVVAGLDRLTVAQREMLGYLTDRDRVLQEQRDRTLLELVEEFAAGVSASERVTATQRLRAALGRRRAAEETAETTDGRAGRPAPAGDPGRPRGATDGGRRGPPGGDRQRGAENRAGDGGGGGAEGAGARRPRPGGSRPVGSGGGGARRVTPPRKHGSPLAGSRAGRRGQPSADGG